MYTIKKNKSELLWKFDFCLTSILFSMHSYLFSSMIYETYLLYLQRLCHSLSCYRGPPTRCSAQGCTTVAEAASGHSSVPPLWQPWCADWWTNKPISTLLSPLEKFNNSKCELYLIFKMQPTVGK